MHVALWRIVLLMSLVYLLILSNNTVLPIELSNKNIYIIDLSQLFSM